jgi:hypothetical protein
VRLELPRCWRRGQEAAELALFFIFPCDGLNPEVCSCHILAVCSCLLYSANYQSWLCVLR